LGVSGALFEANDITARTNDTGILTSLLYLSRIAHKRQKIAPPPSVQYVIILRSPYHFAHCHAVVFGGCRAEIDAEAETDTKRSSAHDEKYKVPSSILSFMAMWVWVCHGLDNCMLNRMVMPQSQERVTLAKHQMVAMYHHHQVTVLK
jgi:hypothetical protein